MPEKQADTPEPMGFVILDPKGAWFRLNAQFDMEDPTNAWNAGGPAKLPKFVAGSYTQATETAWTAAQHKHGVLTKYSGRPGDKDVVEVAYVEPPAAVETPVSGTVVEVKKPEVKK